MRCNAASMWYHVASMWFHVPTWFREAIHDGGVSHILVDDALMLHGVEGGQGGEEEVPGVVWPPGPPDNWD